MQRLIPVLFMIAAAMAQPSWARELKPVTPPHAPATPLQLPDIQGKMHALSDYKGKVVLVNFWATWCPPCRAEMPSMQRLKQHMAGKPFAILAIDMGETEAEVRSFLHEMKSANIDFTILLDKEGKELKTWKISVFPTSFVIDADGKLRYSLLGATEWDEYDAVHKIEGLLPAQTAEKPSAPAVPAPPAASGQ